MVELQKNEFRRFIEKELVGISRKQALGFAYRCAMRGLPFLGADRTLYYGAEGKHRQFLFAIFRALDIVFIGDSRSTAIASVAAVNSAAAAYNPHENAAVAIAAAVANAARAAAADTVNAAKTAAAAAAIAVNDAVAIHHYSNDDWDCGARGYYQEQIIDDLQNIKAEKAPKVVNVAVYHQVWTNFQKILKETGCGYWGHLYQEVFGNNFEQDPDKVLQRLKVPEAIRQQGAEVVGKYLEELERGAQRLNEARIIILGDKGAGKTSLARRLVDLQAPMTSATESTAGVDTLHWPVKGEEGDINVSIWDFAGHTVTHAAHRFFLSERCLYILVHNGRTENNARLTYWLDHMKNYGGASKAIILVNKRDENRVEVPYHNLREQYQIEGLHAFSIKDDQEDLTAFREMISDYIRNNPSWSNEQIPESYYKVKEELERLFRRPEIEKPQEYISKAHFQEIAARHEVENVEQLLKDLHYLGVSLWYDEIKAFDSLVLNPEWISHGVYRIINWVSNKEKSGIAQKEFMQVFEDELERYPEGECHDFLFDLMKHYELAYQTTAGKRLIIPHLLKEDRPAELPMFESGESLKLQYRAGQPLPPHTISRFIVRHHEQIRKPSEVWRYGVVLKDGKGSVALVREERWIISVSVKGFAKSDFIDQLRATLNDIFDSYRSERPTLEYRVRTYGERFSSSNMGEPMLRQEGLFLSEKKVLNHVRNHRPYYDDQADKDIYLDEATHVYKLGPQYDWHVFLSHASEDKEAVAIPLARALKKHGIQVWLDVEQILLGDKLKDKLTEGVSKSRYGIVVFSDHYFQKKWPQQELAALLSRESRTETAIIPILYGVTMDDVKRQELMLADRVAISMEEGMDRVVEMILRVLGRG